MKGFQPGIMFNLLFGLNHNLSVQLSSHLHNSLELRRACWVFLFFASESIGVWVKWQRGQTCLKGNDVMVDFPTGFGKMIY